ncbi:Uncharacterised protein [Mycobacteroides abscessus subsp. abscessus]|nr:Uncharacterised protein [Mycobacteroides abscessus subsp. abscessus]
MPLTHFTVRSSMCSASQSIGVRRCVRLRWSLLCQGPSTSASRTISQPVSVCQVVSRIMPPGRYRRAAGTLRP